MRSYFRRCVALVIAVVASSVPSHGETLSEATIDLAPHRAVYDLSLSAAGAGSNVTDINGQLVYDFTGSPCEGYTLNTRLITEIADREGKPSVTDIRSQTFERADAGQYRFDTSQYINNKLSEATKGVALRRAGTPNIAVQLDKPSRNLIGLKGNLFFPTQHTVAVLKLAVQGQARLQADIYDGSEKGAKVYETTTAIGTQFALDDSSNASNIKNAEVLNGMKAWPVVVSYYDQSKIKDGLPSYEVSFRLFANGVSRKLKLDYGTFSLVGDLKSIEFTKVKPCQQGRRTRG